MNLPNAITMARIFLVPLLVVVLLTKFEGRLVLGVRKELVGAAIFGIASLTDWLDGYLARRRQQVTTGKAPAAKLDEMNVTVVGADRRIVTFVQRFGDNAVRKELTLLRETQGWRIVAERTLEVL